MMASGSRRTRSSSRNLSSRTESTKDMRGSTSDRDRKRNLNEERNGRGVHQRSPHERIRRHRSRSGERQNNTSNYRVEGHRSSPSHGERYRGGERRDRRSRFDKVRVKTEPNSDDEDNGEGRRRRNRGHERKGEKDEEAKPKEKANFGLSGKLAEDTNIFNGVVIKYNEPEEARKPTKRWRLYPFKGDQPLPMLPIHRQSAYLLGRERKVADIPIDHPSCSKQHAVLQFRMMPYEREDGTTGRRIKPYIIDLESANGTFVNNNKIDVKRYVELIEKDVIKFGYSSREYVLLHEGSIKANEEEDGEVETQE